MTSRQKIEPQSQSWILRHLGEEIAAQREAVGMTQEELGQYTICSRKTVSAYELGTLLPPKPFIERAEAAIRIPGTLMRLWRKLNDGPQLDWFARYLRMEAQAVEIRHFESHLIPGLLQTEAYARAVYEIGHAQPAKRIDEHVEARMARQKVLTRSDPPDVWFVLDEAMFRRWPKVHGLVQPQLEHVLNVSRLPNVRVQVTPFEDGQHVGMFGLMTLLSFTGGDDCVYEEPVGSGRILTDPTIVANVQRRYDLLRADALSRAKTEEFLTGILGKL
ncbi:helix-turn-helix transcriptional regulator [Streptomyces sp. SID3343]|uniref:helix-turn-helix domain-containing protein n=1 Tax=Streptomyces sp. SID3343 TaxID=2690260 RepID=UPI00136F9A8A|nr:helix-turn-helix transcriptional regulator [Streptomyces sp. SID3343]MYV98791.1 helix-turn-helix domain-containing protein [Streptomyces sp. SID3343]